MKRIKFFIQTLKENEQGQSYFISSDLRQIDWKDGINIDQVLFDIKKCVANYLGFLPLSQEMNMHSLTMLDHNENLVSLSEKMDFDIFYKVRVYLVNPTSINEVNFANLHQYAINYNYTPTLNQSLLYSPTTLNATSLFRSPNIGESYNQFRGNINNWDNVGLNDDILTPQTGPVRKINNVSLLSQPNRWIPEWYKSILQIRAPQNILRQKSNKPQKIIGSHQAILNPSRLQNQRVGSLKVKKPNQIWQVNNQEQMTQSFAMSIGQNFDQEIKAKSRSQIPIKSSQNSEINVKLQKPNAQPLSSEINFEINQFDQQTLNQFLSQSGTGNYANFDLKFQSQVFQNKKNQEEIKNILTPNRENSDDAIIKKLNTQSQTIPQSQLLCREKDSSTSSFIQLNIQQLSNCNQFRIQQMDGQSQDQNIKQQTNIIAQTHSTDKLMQKNTMKDANQQRAIQNQSHKSMMARKEQNDVFQENFRLDQSKVINKPYYENQSMQPLKKDSKPMKESTVPLGLNNNLMSMPSFGPGVTQFKSQQSQSINVPSAIIAQSLSSQKYINFYNHQIQEQNQSNKFSGALRNQTGTGYFVQASESNQSHLSSAVQTPHNISNINNITPHHIRQKSDNSVLDQTYPSPNLRMIARKPDESMISNLQFDRLNTSHFQLKPYFQVQDQQKAINFNEISYLKNNKMINEDQYQNFHLQQQNPKKYQVLNLQHARKGSQLSNGHRSNISSDDVNVDTLSSQCDLTQSRDNEFDKSQSFEQNPPINNQQKLSEHHQYTPYQYPGYEYNLKYLNNELLQDKNINIYEKDVLSQTMARQALQPFQFKKQTNQGYPLQSELQLIPNDKSSGFDTERTNYLQNKFNARQFPNLNQHNNANGWNTQRGRVSPLDMFNDPNLANTDRQRFLVNHQAQGNQKQTNCYEQNGCLNQHQKYQNDQNQINKQTQKYQNPFYKQNELPSPFLNPRHDFPYQNQFQRNISHNYQNMQNFEARFSQFQQREHFENENYNIPQTPYALQRNLDNQYQNNFRQFQNRNEQQIIDKLEYQDRNKGAIQVPIYQTKSSTIQQNINNVMQQTPQNTYFQKLYQKIQEDSERIAQYSKRNLEENTPRLKSKSPQQIFKQKRKQDGFKNVQKYASEIQTPSDQKPRMRQTTNQYSYEKSVKIQGSKSVENLSAIEKNSSSLNYNDMVTQGNELCVLFDYDKQQKKIEKNSQEIPKQDNKRIKIVINDQELAQKTQFKLMHEIKIENIQPSQQIKLSNENQQVILNQKPADETESIDQNKKNPTTQKIISDLKGQNNSISSISKVNTSGDKGLSRVNSMRIQDQLLSHVKQNGFKEGFNNQKNEDSNRMGFEMKETKKISQFSRKKSREQLCEEKQNNSQSSNGSDGQKETKTIIDQKQKKKSQNIIFNNSPKLKQAQDDKKQSKEILEWDLKVKINNQPVEVNRLTQTPLGQLMNKIGLQLTTGDHLNKLLVQKTRSIEANLRSHSEGDSFSRSNYAALMSTSQDFSNQKIDESKKEMQKASVQSKNLKSRKSSKQNAVLNKVDSRHSSQKRKNQKELTKINETGDFMGQASKVLVGLSEYQNSDVKSQKSQSSQSISRQLNNYVINAPVTPVQEPKFVQQQFMLQPFKQIDFDTFKTPQATTRKPVKQAKDILPIAQPDVQMNNFVAKTPEQTRKSKPKNQISKGIEHEDVCQKHSLESKSDYSGLPQIQRKQEHSKSDISTISHLQPAKSQYGWDGQTQQDQSEKQKYQCPDRKAENSQSDKTSMFSSNLIEQQQINQQKKPTQKYSQNFISNNLERGFDWDIKTVINKPKDYDNTSQSPLILPVKRIQENSVSDISALSQFGKFLNQPINWDAKTANIKKIDDWANSPLLPPTKRLIEKTNSEISQSYVNTFKTPFMQPRKFGKNVEIEEQSSTGPMPGLESKRRIEEKSVSDVSAPIQSSPFLTLKKDLIKEQKSAKQPKRQYFQQVYNPKAFETEEGVGQKIDFFFNKEAQSNASQSLSSQQNFKTNSNSQNNTVTIATIQGKSESGVTIVKVPEQVDNNTYGFNQQLKQLMRQSQEKFQNSSNKIQIKYNGSFQLNKDSLIRSQTSQHKSQHSNNSSCKQEKKNNLQRTETFANLEGSIQNQREVNQAKSQQFKSNEMEEKPNSDKSLSEKTEETKEQQTISKTII